MLIKKKPVDDTKLKFAPFGSKPVKPQTADVENVADAAKPGDAAEDAKAGGQQKASKKGSKKAGGQANLYAKKAAAALAKGK